MEFEFYRSNIFCSNIDVIERSDFIGINVNEHDRHIEVSCLHGRSFWITCSPKVISLIMPRNAIYPRFVTAFRNQTKQRVSSLQIETLVYSLVRAGFAMQICNV